MVIYKSERIPVNILKKQLHRKPIPGNGFRIGDHKAVFLTTLEDGDFLIQFSSRVQPDDFQGGKLQPRADAYRCKKQIYTVIPITRQSLIAFKQLLNEIDLEEK